jgi:type II restriction/modification system DNA methylase subunit YeeA
MNKAKLKTYAPQARKDFIAAVSARANQLGISGKSVSPAERRGDILIIDGREWPADIGPQRDRLIQRIGREGFSQTMEAMAYTWFNRVAALRYMEIHDYLGHGHRVLSNRDGGLPEILRHAAELSLPGLDADKVREMQLAGNRDGELYKLVLVAQCNGLSTAMPFLFEHIDDETELLLPENLLRTDSIVAKLIETIPEEDWQQVEVIGWLYQFYISDKKDEVIGNVAKSEDIPAATQLFTPNWIVQYLVQNSVGRLWMMANPTSTLKSQWPYYIEPAEQSPEVQTQLNALIQTRMADEGGSLNPETITVLDPACGSGHILVEAYEVLKAIYLERGYQPRNIPRLILEKNLYGLDIDDRAAQLAGFALLMKARADDRRLLDNPPKLNVLAMQESKGGNLDELSRNLQPFGIGRAAIGMLIDTFAHAKTFGSLIQISGALASTLPKISEGLISAIAKGDIFAQAAAHDLLRLAKQATVIGMKFDAVAANPPYMGMRGMFSLLKKLAKDSYPDSKADLFSMFLDRARTSTLPTGFVSMVTMHSWMFLSSFETFRSNLLASSTIMSLAHFGPRAFGEISGEVVQTVAFSLLNQPGPEYVPSFLRLVEGGEDTKDRALRVKANCFENISQKQLQDIPGAPIAYWVGEPTRTAFSNLRSLAEIAKPRQGLATSDNGRFLRLWHEVDLGEVGFGIQSREDSKRSEKRWFPCQKGGPARRWYGNHDWLVNWEDDGRELTDYAAELYGSATRTIKNMSFYFKAGISWSTISTAAFAMRYSPEGFISETKGAVCFLDDKQGLFHLLALTNTKLVDYFLKILSPTLDYHEGPVGRLPILETSDARHAAIAMEAVELSKLDWDGSENSWDFQALPLIANRAKGTTLFDSWNACAKNLAENITRLKALEEENNRLFILSYGMQDYITPDVPDDQITLSWADREKDSKNLVSYAVGCMMGRYSLDAPGLIYAHAGNVAFDATRYKAFPADADGIVPLTDELWFEDDAANRIREFLLAVWGAGTIDENMAWLAESLGSKGNEMPEETIRRYIASSFYKDHLQTYKKRPIYWLFSSGKQGAFQCLVYLHRYHEGTLSRLRAEYVVPLTAKIAARIDLLSNDAEAALSAAARTKINKQIEVLRKKQTELLAFDEKLRHYADMRIKLDLDDGVKANYGKFGDLLDSVKAITGGAGDD